MRQRKTGRLTTGRDQNRDWTDGEKTCYHEDGNKRDGNIVDMRATSASRRITKRGKHQASGSRVIFNQEITTTTDYYAIRRDNLKPKFAISFYVRTFCSYFRSRLMASNKWHYSSDLEMPSWAVIWSCADGVCGFIYNFISPSYVVAQHKWQCGFQG